MSYPTEKRAKKSRCVVDASVAVKLFSDEDGSGTVRNLFRLNILGKTSIIAPDLLIYEVGNALAKGKKLSADAVWKALSIIQNSPIQIISPDNDLVEISTRLAERYAITFYDAVYGAASIQFDCPLITSNPKHHGKIKEIKLKVI